MWLGIICFVAGFITFPIVFWIIVVVVAENAEEKPYVPLTAGPWAHVGDPNQAKLHERSKG